MCLATPLDFAQGAVLDQRDALWRRVLLRRRRISSPPSRLGHGHMAGVHRLPSQSASDLQPELDIHRSIRVLRRPVTCSVVLHR